MFRPIKYSVFALTVGASLLMGRPAFSAEMWETLMCFPAPTCMGNCQPWHVARPSGTSAPQGCQAVGTFPSFEMAKRNADAMSGRMPSFSSEPDFEHYYRQGEQLRAQNNIPNARLMYQNAASRAGNMEESLYAALALLATGDVQAALDILGRARDLSHTRAQYTVVGDAFNKAGRRDLAQVCYDRANSARE